MTKRCRIPLLLFLSVLVCYGYCIHFIGLESWNASSRLDLVYSLAEYGTFRIDPYHQNTGDKVALGDHYYSDKAPGVSLLAVPGYLLLKWLGVSSERFMRYGLTLLSVGIPSALGVVLFYGLTGLFADLRAGSRVTVALAYGLGTLAFPFSTVFYGHQMAAAAGIASFFIMFRVKNSRPRSGFFLLWLSGFLAGYAFLCDYPAGIVMVLMGAYSFAVLRRKAGILAWCFGAAIPAGFLLYYNNACFGSPFTSAYSLHQTYSHSAGFLGITWPKADALWGITFSPYRGLFYQAPVLLFALPGFYFFCRRRQLRLEFFLSLLVVFGFFFFNAGYAYWDGVGSTGARFLIPALPFLALPLAGSMKKWPVSVTALAIFSFISMLVITVTEPRAEWRVQSPLLYFNLFLFLRGYLSDNLGMLLGLRGWLSLLPLLIVLGILWAAFRRALPVFPRREATREKLIPALGLLGMVLLWMGIAGWEEPGLREVDQAESLFRYYRGRGGVNWEEVEEHYQRAIEADPQFLDPYLRLAEIARMRGHPRLALSYYEELAKVYPDSPLLLREMALVYDLLGETDKAEKALLRTVELAPDDASLRNQLAAFYWSKNRRPEAIAQWEESLRIDPGDKRVGIQLKAAREQSLRPDKSAGGKAE